MPESPGGSSTEYGEARMKRTNHSAEAALATMALKSPTASSQVDRDSSGIDRARMKHPSAAYVQVMDRTRWFISSMDPDALTAGFRVTRHFPLVGDAVPATPFTRIGFMDRDERRG